LETLPSPRGFYAVQYRFGLAVSDAAGRHPHLATQQKLGLLPQRWTGFGLADYFVVDVYRSSLMTDFIRQSAANLLAITLAMAADFDEVQKAVTRPSELPTGHANPSSLTTDEDTLTQKLDQK
jgi:hypothetical protein